MISVRNNRTHFVLKEDQMEKTDTVIAVFADHNAAEAAVKTPTAGGFEMKNLMLISSPG